MTRTFDLVAAALDAARTRLTPDVPVVLGVGVSTVAAVVIAGTAPTPSRTARGAHAPHAPSAPTSGAPTASAIYTCTHPLTVLYNHTGAPENPIQDLNAAITTIAAASHRTIIYRGTTATSSDELTSYEHPVIVVRWTKTYVHLDGDPGPDALAVGGATEQGGHLIGGDIEIAGDTAPPAGPVRGGLRVLLEHELIHAPGTDQHSASPADVIYPALLPTKSPALGPGDRRDLAATGCPVSTK